VNGLLFAAAALAMIPAANTLINLFLLQTPRMPKDAPLVAILIPARNEQANIGACVDAALSSVGADVEVIVLDDGSTDRTRSIVEERAARNSRLRIASAPDLPVGWMGKPHACQVLSQMTSRPFLLFIDADVRLAPEAAARLVPAAGVDLVSGIPHQRMEGVVEMAVIPMINALIYGYLPTGFMRLSSHGAFAAACGQLMMVRASAYRRSGGHSAVAGFMHDAMQLAKLFRRNGLRTDLVDGTRLADCRMYDTPSTVIEGFAKNATEGMARPIALPIWTVLLAGGHLLPLIATLAILFTGNWAVAPGICVISATACLGLARTLQAVKCRESAATCLLHPLAILLTLAIQWGALYRALRGGRVEWRGRSYAPKF
jgi:cellulose synthase/poly-beta-1,6-N-acetylglucosamine synthase-like glycosyltransferase